MKTTVMLVALYFSASGNVQALETINFPSQPGPHSAFKIKKAAAKGLQLAPRPSTELTGYLGTPGNTVAAPAVILLHGDNGLKDYHKQWAAQLNQWGYVSLLIYSFGAMGEQLPESVTVSGDVLSNAYGAYNYLQALPGVDPQRIAVMGWWGGGSTAFDLVKKTPPPGRKSKKPFTAAVSVYPVCNPNGDVFSAPMLVMLGDNDKTLQKGHCQQFKLASEEKNPQQQIQLQVYPGATLFYDDPVHPSDKTQKSVYYYAPQAHQDSLQRVKKFLAENL